MVAEDAAQVAVALDDDPELSLNDEPGPLPTLTALYLEQRGTELAGMAVAVPAGERGHGIGKESRARAARQQLAQVGEEAGKVREVVGAQGGQPPARLEGRAPHFGVDFGRTGRDGGGLGKRHGGWVGSRGGRLEWVGLLVGRPARVGEKRRMR